MSVVITEDLWWSLPTWLESRYSVFYDPLLANDRARLLMLVKTAQALVVRNKTQVDLNLLDAAPQLKVVGRLGVGVDNIDQSACRDRGVQVVTARGCNGDAVAEYVLASMLHHARFLYRCNADVRAGQWDRQSATGGEIGGKTLGLLGAGDIAQRVAHRAQAFDMKVIGYDPYLAEQDAGIFLTDLDTVIGQADYLSIHVPLTAETHYLIGAQALSRMKPGAILINTARGSVVDEQALRASLMAHPDRHAFLDVREQEPPAANDPLYDLPNITFTPHIAGITYESAKRVAAHVLKEVHRVLSA